MDGWLPDNSFRLLILQHSIIAENTTKVNRVAILKNGLYKAKYPIKKGKKYDILDPISIFCLLMSAENVKKELNKASDKGKVASYQRFFKTGKGEYGEGDWFIGVTVPKQRIIAKKYQKLPLAEISHLFGSPVHEHRLTGLLILTYQFSRAAEHERREIFDFYLEHTDRINNWDLVDATAPNIVGEYLLKRNISILRRLAISDSLWERRIAILSTFAFIKQGKHEECFELAKILMQDRHDLMHKAVGWMLREVGKRCDEKLLRDFLDQHTAHMPRTMLRYAIERLPEEERLQYLRWPREA